MSGESNKIIVKVGKTSNVRFSHSKVFRAITVEELEVIARRNDDCHIVVIENIASYEEDELKKFITNFKNKDEHNEIFFFIPDNDDVTSGVADELDYNIYLKLNDLYTVIYNDFGINVSILIEDKQKYNSAEMQESIDDEVPDLFGSLEEDDEKQLAEELEAVTEEKTEHEIAQEAKEESKDFNLADMVGMEESLNDSREDYGNDIPDLSEEIAAELSAEFDAEELSDVSTDTESSDESADDSEAISKLKLKLRDMQYDYSVAVKDMKAANTRIETLENIIKALKDEKDTLIERFNSLVETTDVIEDPISLAQYNKLNEVIEQNEENIKDLTGTVENLKATVAEREEDIEEKKNKIEELRNNIDELNVKLSEINNSIESGEIHKDIVEEYEEKIKEVNDERDKLIIKLNSLQADIDALYGKIDDLSNLADTESAIRVNTLDTLKLAIEKLLEYKDKLVAIESEKEELSNKLDSLTTENNSNKKQIELLSKSTAELKEKADTADKRIELANSYSETEKGKLEDIITELKTKLNITEQQLQQKEAQYLQLVSASGIDASGASALVETNKTLEGITKTLREQLGTANKENESLKKKTIELNTAVESYKGQVNQLSNALKEMASAGGGASASIVGANVLMKPIQYMGNAVILPVFGSGSFGITTMAMSLATKLCITSNVLYLDFDMVAPKADAWFNKMPLCQRVPGINPNDRRMTGLGIFYELGLQMFQNNFDNIVNKCDRTKGGGIDYLSGVYYRVDSFKVSTADYSSLFNFLATKYQYIVIDLGRLGSSDINDRLIKNITDITDKSVCITTSDIFEIRSFKAKLIEDSIDVNRLAWLINMCNSTNIDERIKSTIKPAQYGIMLTDTSLYGTREKFTRNKLNKDKLDLFINSALFSGRR